MTLFILSREMYFGHSVESILVIKEVWKWANSTALGKKLGAPFSMKVRFTDLHITMWINFQNNSLFIWTPIKFSMNVNILFSLQSVYDVALNFVHSAADRECCFLWVLSISKVNVIVWGQTFVASVLSPSTLAQNLSFNENYNSAIFRSCSVARISELFLWFLFFPLTHRLDCFPNSFRQRKNNRVSPWLNILFWIVLD